MRTGIRKLGKSCPMLAAMALLAQAAQGEFEPAIIKDMVEPRFPLEVATDGVREGSATILIEIDADGELEDWLPLSATHEGFVRVIAEVIDEWAFQPARRDGEAVRSNLPLQVRFRSDGLLVSMSRTQIAADMMSGPLGEKKEEALVTKLRNLDRIPEAVETARPAFSPDMEDTAGQPAVFRLYIDEKGRVRIPVLIQSSGDSRLDLSAYDALLQWRFEPPMKKGRPVVAVAEQQFQFGER